MSERDKASGNLERLPRDLIPSQLVHAIKGSLGCRGSPKRKENHVREARHPQQARDGTTRSTTSRGEREPDCEQRNRLRKSTPPQSAGALPDE